MHPAAERRSSQEMTANSDMSYPMRSLVPRTPADVAPAHSVRFYGDEARFLDELSQFLGGALGAGGAVIVVATQEHRNGLARRLKMRGLDIAALGARGQYSSLDAAEMLARFMRDGMPDATLFTDCIGGVIETAAAQGASPSIAVFGEMVALLAVEGKPEAAIRLEHLWNDLSRVYSFTIRCAYPLSSFRRVGDGELMEEICAAHAHVIPTESYTSLIDEEARLREVTLLQQKAQALETEIESRKKAQQALRERNQELRAAVAARDDFLSIAAHELKTPITSLRGFAQLLLRDARRQGEIAPERLRSALDTVERQTGKLQHLVTCLLDTAQLGTGKLRIEPVDTDLVGLVHAALAQHQGGTHSFVFDGPEHLEVVVDPVRFGQVIAILLGNAVKFSPQGGVVTVRLEQDAEGNIRLSVTDHGVGIPPDQRVNIFNRFHQAHGTHHLSGMGLGLYITREIVELHGGFVHVEEPEHQGSRFVVGLSASVLAMQVRVPRRA
jgi:signal transduction histidine kinase